MLVELDCKVLAGRLGGRRVLLGLMDPVYRTISLSEGDNNRSSAATGPASVVAGTGEAFSTDVLVKFIEGTVTGSGRTVDTGSGIVGKMGAGRTGFGARR